MALVQCDQLDRKGQLVRLGGDTPKVYHRNAGQVRQVQGEQLPDFLGIKTCGDDQSVLLGEQLLRRTLGEALHF
jgi:hypothetical protein